MTTQAIAADAVQRMVADEVRAEMARQRKTAAELALAIGVTQHTIGRRINGATPFNVFELARVAVSAHHRTLDVSVAEANGQGCPTGDDSHEPGRPADHAYIEVTGPTNKAVERRARALARHATERGALYVPLP